MKTAKSLLRDQHTQEWNNNLDDLTVQSEFKDVAMLEEENKMWNHLLTGLPAGQLSFTSRAGMDCLPAPLNLRCWGCYMDLTCLLCGCSQPATLHILNGCPEALNQGHFSCLHDSVLNCLLFSMSKHVCPDMVLREWRSLHILELAVCSSTAETDKSTGIVAWEFSLAWWPGRSAKIVV